jgi:hypothetical protein
MSTKHNRPWYCRGGVVDEYKDTLQTDGQRLPMLKTLKIIRAIIVNVGMIGIAGYAIGQGGDPTLLGGLALGVLGLYNGLELSDYAALLQAYKEVQIETRDDGDR